MNYTDANGCNATTPTVKNVTVNARPVPGITGASTSCATTTGVTYSTESGKTGYLWTISAGGAISTGSGTNNITVTWNSVGAQTVNVDYTDANGCNATTATVKNVTVNSLPSASISPGGSTTFCQGGSVTLTASAGSSYAWSTGATSQSISASSTGNYSVMVTNSFGCSATSTPTPVTVSPGAIDGTIQANTTYICLGQSFTISSTGGNGAPHYWGSTNGGSSWNLFEYGYGGQYSFNYTPSSPGTYRFAIRNHNSCGWCWETGTCAPSYSYVDVTVAPGPVDATVYASASSMYIGQNVTISSSGGTGTPYYWASTNGGASWNVFAGAYGGQSSFNFTTMQLGTYLFHVRNQNSCGFCWETGTCAPGSVVSVTVNPATYDGTIWASATSICLGHSVTISSSGGNGTPYYWASTDGGSSWNVFGQAYGGQSSFTFTPSYPGTYRFHLRNHSQYGFCWDTGTCFTYPYVDVEVYQGYGTISTWGDLCYGTVDLTAGPGYNYQWSNGSTSQYIFVSSEGAYDVTYTTYDGCRVTQGTSVYCYGYRKKAPAIVKAQGDFFNSTKITDEKSSNSIGFNFFSRPFNQTTTSEPEKLEAGNPSSRASFSHYPNPANQELTIQLPEVAKQPVPVKLFDQLGKMVHNSVVPAGQSSKTINTSDFISGTYLLQIESDQNSFKKVLIVHEK